MTIKKAAKRTKGITLPPHLTKIQADLLWHMERGYQLETSSLEGVLLRRLKDNELVRPASANLGTVEALEERGLISPTKSKDPLTTVWRVSRKPAK